MTRREDEASATSDDANKVAPPEGSPSELAMVSRQRLTGSAAGVGSVDFDDPGAFDVGADERHAENADTSAPRPDEA